MRIPYRFARYALFTSLLLACEPSVKTEPAGRLADSYKNVDPFIATGGTGFGHGSAYPGAVVPYGLVKLSPDTQGGIFGRAGFAHFAGYWYGDSIIEGFSHIHLHGVGALDTGTLTFMPVVDFGDAKTRFEGYATGFTHDNESAEPGYYRVLLDNGIEAELTATPRTGVHRYKYPSEKAGTVIIDLVHALEGVTISTANIQVFPEERRVSGWFTQYGAFSRRFGGLTVYFDAEFNAQWDGMAIWNDAGFVEQAHAVTDAAEDGLKRLGAAFTFAPEQVVEVNVGVSLVDLEGAKSNREAEVGGHGFDDIAERARDAWREPLSTIRVWGGTPRQQRIFYTALYHTMHMPTVYSDVDERYRTVYGGVAKADGWTFYSDMSLWDTYRTLHPLVNILDSERATDFARSLVAMGASRGALPRWPMTTGDGASMIATPADIVLADSYLKGIVDFDVDAAFTMMVSSATLGDPYRMRPSLESYLELGYCPADESSGSVSRTLESMYADFAIAQLASALGETSTATEFRQRAMQYGKLFDPAVGFFRGKTTEGTWSAGNFSPTDHGEDYVEGTAWQYLWFVPWDPQGLADLLGGGAAARSKLTQFFEEAAARPTNFVGAVQFPDDFYWHGNEPDIHAAYLFAMLDDPASTVKWVRWIREEKYDDTPAGLDGNDDGGTLSAWYVFSALGFYPLPAETRYVLGVPLFERAEVSLANGKTLVVEWPGASDESSAVARVLWNGEPVEGVYLEHSALMDGGTLRFER